MPAPVLQFKRGIFSNLPGLRAGEPGFTTDSYELYVGIDSTTNSNKFFGSHRYWTRQTATTGSGVNLVEGSNNGSDYITLASPGTVGAAVTYYFPAANGSASAVLTNDGSGNLSWAGGSASPVFSGISTFSDTTDNTLGNENTGAVQIDGGMGIAKNLTVKENLHVGGYAEFVGVVTFKGGTINLGDAATDNIAVTGEFTSNLVPNTDATSDLGITTQRWKTLKVVNVDTTNLTGTAGTITTFNSTTGTITNLASTNVNVSGLSTFTGIGTFGNDLFVGGDLQITGNDIKSSTGAVAITLAGNDVTVADDLTVSGNLFVNGSTTQVNTAALTVEDRTIDLGIVNGAAPSGATTWDLGILFNYYATTAKKSAVIWEHADTRFKFASVLAADTDGNSSSTPQLTVTTFAPIEIGELWVNDCAGASQVISCTGTTRNLENITIDCGTF